MRREKCICGNKSFKVNPIEPMVQCWDCGRKKLWNPKNKSWSLFKLDKIQTICRVASDLVKIPITKTMEIIDVITQPKAKRKHKLFEQKPTTLSLLKKERQREQLKKTKLKSKWSSELKILKKHNRIVFENNAHKGKLRGKHIAKAFHSDMKYLGLKTRLRFVRDKAIVEAI